MSCQLAKLINKNYQKLTSQYEVDDYIRQLRFAVKELKLQNDFLLETQSYLPIKQPINNYSFNDQQVNYEDIQDPEVDYYAITLTFDSKKFPQLIITPDIEQIKYIKKVISTILYERLFTRVYGSFEKHKSGIIHFHGVIPLYKSLDNKINLDLLLKPYFTDSEHNKHAVLTKPVDDLQLWIKYINKPETYKIFLEWNFKKNTLEI